MDTVITVVVFAAVAYFIYWRLKVRKAKRDEDSSTGTGTPGGGGGPSKV